MNTPELHEYELHRTRTTPGPAPEARHRATFAASRRQARRHRLADRVRSVADRLEA